MMRIVQRAIPSLHITLVAMGWWIAAVSGVRAADAAEPRTRANVILLMSDDQGYGDLSCHGNPVLKTPALDRLHAESVRFTDFHVCPMCTPTRGALMTGLDALRNGATSVTAGRSFLRAGLPTAPEIFAANGYKTGIFGKWHLGDNYPNRPMDRGFQTAVYHLGWGFTSAPEFDAQFFDGRCFRNGEPSTFEGYVTDAWFDEAMNWMGARQKANEPFFCYLPTNAPHGPCVVAEKYSAPYAGKGPAAFFGMIANLDENVARLETFLQERGLRENTILIFLTDNGGTAGVQLYNAGLRDKKTSNYDGGHRVPFFVRWPAGSLGAPRDVGIPAQAQDVLPTLIELCGLTPPSGAKFDGLSLAAVLTDEQQALPDRMLVVQYGQVPKKWDSCVVWNQWRLVSCNELYDVNADRAQTKNVVAEHPEVVAKMRAHYDAWWSEVSPGLGDFVTISLGSEQQPVVPLTSSDWEDRYVDNARLIRQLAGGPYGGVWNVFVERAGEYEIEIRRWPPEKDWALGAAAPTESKAIPTVAAGRLAIADLDVTEKCSSSDRSVKFNVKLPAGKTRLHSWFEDADEKALCGAFYTTVRFK